MTAKKSLYRDSQHAKIAGVCAGIANYFGMEHWLMRILFVTGFFLLAGPFVLVGYIAAWFILDKQPRTFSTTNPGTQHAASSFDSQRIEVKTRVWQAGEPPKRALHDIAQQFSSLEQRLRRLETYVTSKEYQLRREIHRL